MVRALGSIAMVFIILLANAPSIRASDGRLQIGVTLHPYYSWVTNLAGDAADVLPVIPAHADPHAYQPRPEDIRRLSGLDVIVVNGLGHDDFIEPMLAAAGQQDLPRVNLNEGIPLVPAWNPDVATRDRDNPSETQQPPNSHSFISIISATQQIHHIAQVLGRLDPVHADVYENNARSYAKRLRTLLSEALSRLTTNSIKEAKIAAVHDGYSYLLQELGLELTAVIQPRHGIEPSPRQLADSIKRLKRADVDVLFTEMDYVKGFADVIREETGTRIFKLTHISSGEYTPDQFEKAMAQNLNIIAGALQQAN